MNTITVTQEGLLEVGFPSMPNEVHILQAPSGEKWTLTGNGSSGELTVDDGASAAVDEWNLFDSNGTPWEVSIDDSGILFLTGFDKNILLAPVVNNPILMNGLPAVGYQLFSFQAGTMDRAVTYRNQGFISEQPIPIVLNDFGLPTDPIFLVSGVEYDFTLVPPGGGPPIKTWPSVLIGPPSDVSIITQWLTQAVAANFLSTNSFSIVGDVRALFRAGRRVGLEQSVFRAGMITGTTFDGAKTIISVVLDSGTVDNTLSSVTVGLLSPPYGAMPGRRHLLSTTFFSGTLTIPFSGGFNILTPGTLALCLKPVPAGWLECNGQAVSRTTYAALFASISTTFGAGNGTTTFNVPTIATTGMGANTATTNAITAGNFVYCIYAQG